MMRSYTPQQVFCDLPSLKAATGWNSLSTAPDYGLLVEGRCRRELSFSGHKVPRLSSAAVLRKTTNNKMRRGGRPSLLCGPGMEIILQELLTRTPGYILYLITSVDEVIKQDESSSGAGTFPVRVVVGFPVKPGNIAG